MKSNFTVTVSAFAFALVAFSNANASAILTIGQNASADCAQAAESLSRDRALPSGAQNALAACDQALNGNLSAQDRTATLVNRGALEAASNRTMAALADFDAALKRDPRLADVYVDRGAALLRAARYVEARADFDRAIQMSAKSVVAAYFNRGMANEKAGDLNAAYRDYQHTQALAPDFAPVQKELARFHVQKAMAAN